MKSRRKFLKRSVSGIAGISFFTKNSLGNSTSPRPNTEKNLPVIEETDICVLGGSCTGVFAAIRAARLGAKVSIIEKQNAFGGAATNSMVFIWHSLLNTEFNKQIISGLTEETMNRLKQRNAVEIIEKSPNGMFRFNSQELKIELDEMVLEHYITPYFHTLFSEPVLNNKGELTGIIIDNKDGRSIIKAKAFIDATGDGDLCHRLNLESYTDEKLLPPTTCAHLENWDRELISILKEHGGEFDFPQGFIWGSNLPGSDTSMIAGTRIYNVNCSNASDLTRAEIEGRRQVRAILDAARKYLPNDKITLTGLPSYIGIRQTRQIKCQYQLTGEDALSGKTFDDTIAYGSYRFDVHHHDKPGITLKYLDGWEEYVRTGYPKERKRWRPESDVNPTFYQIPLRSIIPGKYNNLILAGRMFDSDSIAFSGTRVMVNMNQLGEAAGTAAFLSIKNNIPIPELDSNLVRKTMEKNGSIMLN